MPIPVFDQCNNLHYFNHRDISIIYKDDYSRRHIALVGAVEYFFPHTLEQRGIIMKPLGFYQINRNEIINTTKIDKYKFGAFTIDGRTYYLSRERTSAFESFYFPD